MQKLLKSLDWLDKHILKILVIGFIFITPLYPKLPIQIVNYTYVAIRFEDYYIALMSMVFAVQFLRGKVKINWKMFLLFLAFWTAVFASYLWGFYQMETIEINNLGFLHSVRRIEYMIIFFVAYSTVRSKSDFYQYLKLIFVVVAIVCVYAYGQKFLGWPAVQTMNPEYAKGYVLILDAWSRVSSTFGGHYDLSAYLVLLLPIILGYFIYTGKKIYFALYTLAIATIVLAASRASYGAYIVSIVLYLLFTRKWKILLYTILLTAILTPLSDNLAKRITRTFQPTRIYINSETGEVLVPKDIEPDDLPPGDFGANLTKQLIPRPKDSAINPNLEAEAIEQIRKQIEFESKASGKNLTPEEIDQLVSFTFLKNIPQNTYLLDISASTRLQIEWPRAITAFIKNPLLGSGPSSITEATDGDYFRWLGELGLLGTSLFITILFVVMKSAWKTARTIRDNQSYIFLGFLSGIVGLLANAALIDVFEASKVAYTFWLIAGIFFASSNMLIKDSKAK